MNKNIKSFPDLHDQIDKIVVPADVHKSYDLSRIKKALAYLDNPQDSYKIVHVAGTSGKTSTSYYASEILRRGGYKVGLSVSPHIQEVNERVQINLKPVGEAKFCENLSEYLEILDQGKINLTYFELFVSFAFWYFAKVEVDIAVFEVGLGGLLDATNTINRSDKICAITDIGLDHTSVLGNSISEITDQKAGIIQENNTVFCIDQSAEIIEIIKKTCEQKKAKLFIVKPDDVEQNMLQVQSRNWQLAQQTCDFILRGEGKKLSNEDLKKSKKIIIPGRVEKVKVAAKTLILDGAHNGQKMRGLVESLAGELDEKPVTTVLAVGNNKTDQLLEMSQAIQKISDKIIITVFDEKQDFDRKSLDPEYLAEYFPDVDTEIVMDLKTALEIAIDQQNETILVTGSLYLIGKTRSLLSEIR